MATTQLSPTPVFKAFDNNGNPLYGGQLFTYAAGTSTPQATYTDSTGATPNTNPVILNSRGEANVWLSPSTGYKFILEDSSGNSIWTVDNIQAPLVQIPYGVASGTNTILLNTSPAFATLTDGQPVEFKAASTTTAAATLNVNSTGTLNTYLSDGVTQVRAGKIVANNIYLAIYNSGLNSSAGGWIIVNPSTGDYAATSGTNTITATITGFSAYYDGLRIKLKMANTTTAAATLNVNAIGALNLYYSDGVTQIVAGALIQNNIYTFTYDSSLNASAGGWIVTDPSRVSGSFTGTPTGFSGSPGTCTVTYSVGPDGHSVNMIISNGISGTSNATTFTITGMPLALTPANQQSFLMYATNAGSNVTGCIAVGVTSQVISLGSNATYAGFTAWTASGTKAFPPGGTGVTIQYQI